MSLRSALGSNDLPAVRKMIRELCPGGKPDFDRILKDGTSVKLYRAAAGDVETGTAIFTMIEHANATLNVYKPMNKEQILDLAEEMMEELYWVTMEDLAIFLHGIGKQLWGHVNNRFDAAVVWEFWDVYATKRGSHHYDREAKYQHENKTSEKSSVQIIDKFRNELKNIDTEWMRK